MTQPPTTDQIRHAIDSGATGEKVGFPDPAAAPLGTDGEAGGNALTPAERDMEAAAQTVHRDYAPWDGRPVYLGLVLVIVAAIMLAGWLGSGG